MKSLWISFKKVFKIAVIWLLGVIIAGIEIKYPEIFGYQIFNNYTIGIVLFVIYDWIKHNWRGVI